jgi:hypothetical protein
MFWDRSSHSITKNYNLVSKGVFLKVTDVCDSQKPARFSQRKTCSPTEGRINVYVRYRFGAWDGLVVKALRYYSDGPGIDSRWCHWIFHWHVSFRPCHGTGVDWAPSENEYQKHFLGVKAAGAWGWQPHHLHVPNVMETGEPKPPSLLRDS